MRDGIHYDMTSADYFADPCPKPSLTQSIAKILIDQSPLHAWQEHPRLGGKPPEPDQQYISAQAIGNAAHKLMIGRGKDIEVVNLDAWRGKAADQRREIEASGRVAILSKHFARARSMVKVAREDIEFAPDRGAGEVAIIAQEGDLWLRSLVDWLPTDLLMPTDYKTTGMSCAPQAIDHLMLNGGWDIQAAMHERILDHIDPDNAGRRRFRFVAQENYPPYALTVSILPKDTMTMGRKKLAHAVDLWAQCIDSGRWPGYPSDICYPKYPGWAETKWLDREVNEFTREAQRRYVPETMPPI
jgi:hypothetical protein